MMLFGYDVVTIIVSVIAIIAALFIGKAWIQVYNKFNYWKNKLEEKFAGIDVIMQRRQEMINALAQVAKKYSIHEYKTFKDTAEARSRWSKDVPLNDRVKAVDSMENNFIKIQRVMERYPKIKADKMYQSIMGSGNITRIEKKLQDFRLNYNKVVREYNERVQRFPRLIVAKVHGFNKAEYLTLGNSINLEPHSQYKPKDIFSDEE